MAATSEITSEQITHTLSALQAAQSQQLSVLRLAEPLLAPSPSAGANETKSPAQRASDASSTAADHPTSQSLAQDLQHYRSLFTKLRLSYTTQVTKEKFLRNLISTPRPDPTTLSSSANAELERKCARLKAVLQAQKQEVDALVTELEGRARELGRRWSGIEEGTQELKRAWGEVETLTVEAERLKQEIEVRNADGGDGGYGGLGGTEYGLGLEATVGLVEEREEHLETLDAQLEALAEARASKERKLMLMKDELDHAERTKNEAVKIAHAARRRRQEGVGGLDDEVEDRGRWLRGVEATMRNLLAVKA